MEGVSRGVNANLKHPKQTKNKNVEKKLKKKPSSIYTRTEEIAIIPNLHERKLVNILRRRYKSKYENRKILFKV